MRWQAKSSGCYRLEDRGLELFCAGDILTFYVTTDREARGYAPRVPSALLAAYLIGRAVRVGAGIRRARSRFWIYHYVQGLVAMAAPRMLKKVRHLRYLLSSMFKMPEFKEGSPFMP